MYKELNTYFPDAVTGSGIFSEIANISWFEGVDPANLDTYFILMHGDKLASKLLDNFADSSGHVEGTELKRLAKVIHNAFITNWEHEFKTLTVEYNPIENTDYVETYTGSASGTAGGTTTDSGKVTTTNTTSGLGSSSYAPDEKSEVDYGAGTGADARKSVVSSTSSDSDEHEIRKHGNIGVTTNAQMIESDIDVWKLNKFYDILCSDICKVIALSIF